MSIFLKPEGGLESPVISVARSLYLRCQMAYNIDVVKTNVPDALEILVDSVVNPKFLSWEVNAAIDKMREDIKSVKDNPQTVLLEVRASRHLACFFSNLVNPA